MYETIVVGTDFSETADRAVEQAAELAKSFGATLHVVAAFRSGFAANVASSSLEAMAYGGADYAAEAETKLAEEIETVLRDTAQRLGSLGVKVETHGVSGDPADVLIEVAESKGADLIVVGNRGMSGVKRFLLGSVSNKVSHHAPCSVLIVHTVA